MGATLGVQRSAHGSVAPAVVSIGASSSGASSSGVSSRAGGAEVADRVELRFADPIRRVAPGQSVVLYDGDEVVGGGIAR